MTEIGSDDIDKVCRGCLGKKGDMRPLYGTCLDKMLMNVAEINVERGDGYPELMCVQCVLQVSRAFTFKKLCQRSDETLRILFNNITNTIITTDTSSTIQHQQQQSNEPANVIKKENQMVEVQFEDPQNGEKCLFLVRQMSPTTSSTTVNTISTETNSRIQPTLSEQVQCIVTNSLSSISNENMIPLLESKADDQNNDFVDLIQETDHHDLDDVVTSMPLEHNIIHADIITDNFGK